MEGRREDVKTSPFPVSSVLSLPREVDDLSDICPLPGIYYGAKMNGPHPYALMSIWPFFM